MAEIITLTLNPTVDKSTKTEKLVPENKLTCEQPKFEPGGGGINVSRALKRLGTRSTAVFPSGGLTGQLLQNLLEKEDIEVKPVTTKNENRENFIVVDKSSNQQYRFGMPGPEIYPEEQEAFLHLIEELKPEWLIVSGSLPPGVDAGFITTAAALAKKMKAKFIVDTSGEALEVAAKEGVYLLKPNLGELGKLVGIETMDHNMVDTAAKELINKGHCEIVVVSLGAKGAHLVTKDHAEHIPAPAVKKLSTVGAGDSMVAGMVHALVNNFNLVDVAKMGVACGTAATMNPGTELFHPDDVEKLYGWLQKGKYD
jgi:6-phosphofructokinase 2